jgi:hypothetical protein
MKFQGGFAIGDSVCLAWHRYVLPGKVKNLLKHDSRINSIPTLPLIEPKMKIPDEG